MPIGDWTTVTDMGVDAREELVEATTLLKSAKGSRVKKALEEVVTALEAEIAASPESKVNPVIDAAKAASNGSDLPTVPSEPQAAVSVPPAPSRPNRGAPPMSSVSGRFNTVSTFSWDQGSYNSPKVSVYVPLSGVGTARDRVSCSFESNGFDLKVTGLEGRNYRLLQNNLEKDIVPEESKFLVKKDKVVLKLQKTKLSYGGYEHWNNLSAKKAKKTDTSNPQGAIMDMMKDMYDEGDDNMKKIIGEAMMKSREKGGKPDSFDEPSSYGRGTKGGGPGLGDLDDDMDDLDLDKGVGDYGWGDESKDDFGFGSKAPPPQVPDSGPIAPDDEIEEGEEEEVDASGDGDDVGKVPPMGVSDGMPEEVDGEGANSKNLNALEALDD